MNVKGYYVKIFNVGVMKCTHIQNVEYFLNRWGVKDCIVYQIQNPTKKQEISISGMFYKTKGGHLKVKFK